MNLLYSNITLAETNNPTPAKVDESKIIATDLEKSTEAVTPPASNNKPTIERLDKQQRDLLAATPNPPTPIWVTVAGNQVLGFWQPDLSGHPLGAALLLHDAGDDPLSSPSLFNLHSNLPNYGWATLSIQLPRSTPPVPPHRPIAITTPKTEPPEEKPEATPPVDETLVVFDDSSEEGLNPPPLKAPPNTLQSTQEDTDKQTMACIQAGLAYLKQHGQYNVVVLGEGLGALRALQLAEGLPNTKPPSLTKKDKNKTTTAVIDRPIRAITLINMKNSYSKQTESPLDLFTHPDIPTLDIYAGTGFNAKQEAKTRKTLAKKMMFEVYRQKRLTPSTIVSTEETRLTKTIRGFLDRYARGKEL